MENQDYPETTGDPARREIYRSPTWKAESAATPEATYSDSGSFFDLEAIRRRLLAWYAVHRRELPWRGENDPYKILVSEIMLQQTGVERVRAYYPRFLQEFPDFATLAAAPRLDVLRVWGGLGYNRRAVYLHECAKAVVRDHGGILPSDPVRLKQLPGVGPYTLAALRSFAFHEDVATIDTNIRRVIGRIGFATATTPAAIARWAAELVPPGRSSEWNQALMDFGSAQCTANRPDCRSCPLQDLCHTAGSGSIPTRQVAEPKEPFYGSRRYVRGRIVAHLRTLAAGSSIPLADLAAIVQPESDDPVALIEIAQGLAGHGLARLLPTARGYRIGPPD